MTLTSHVNRGLHTSLRPELSTLVSGKEDLEMDLVSKHGQTVLSTLENGERTEPMEREDSFTLMVIFMMDIGLTTKQTVVVSTNTLTVLSTKVYGKMISSMVMEWKPGQTNQNTRETMPSAGSMELVAISGMMDLCTQVIGVKIRFLVSESTLGLMVDVTKENGLTTIWKVWVSTSGMMAGCIKANTKMTKNMALVYIHGLTGGVMRATGIRESSMESVLTSCLKTTK